MSFIHYLGIQRKRRCHEGFAVHTGEKEEAEYAYLVGLRNTAC